MFKIKNLKIRPKDLPNQVLCLEINELLLPGSNLSLILEEPKNIALIDLVLKDQRRFIAIVTKNKANKITQIACLGKIRSFIETDDRRYLVNIDGICRFQISGFLTLPIRQKLVKANWQNFLQDLNISQQKIKGRTQLNYVTSDYFNLVKNEHKYKLEELSKIKDIDLLNLLIQNLNRQIANKEAILGARDINELSEYYQGFMELKIAECESKQFLKH